MFVWALLAMEDPSFYRHDGIDYGRLAGVAARRVLRRSGGRGATTVTMKLSRNLLPTREGTLKRKLEEMILAREIERRYSKDEILEMYVNQAYFGTGAYGVEAAARSYFGTSPTEFTLPEIALLVGVIESPSRDNPRLDMAAALARRAAVLDRLVDLGYDRNGAERAKAAAVDLAPPPGARGSNSHFVEYVRGYLARMVGTEGVWRGGYRVHTTLDAKLQAKAEELVEEHLSRIEATLSPDEVTRAEWRAVRDRGAASGNAPEWEGATRTPYLQGALVAVDLETGGIVALVGGRDFRESGFDRATHARRRAGPVLEPLVLAAAVREGLPVGRVDGNGRLRLPPDARAGPVIELAAEAGITTVTPSDTLALGEAALIPWQALQAYTMFPTGGERITPIAITRILSRNGEVVRTFDAPRARVLTPEQARVLTSVLQGVIERGTVRPDVRGRGFHWPAAGMPGTTRESTDAWFAGFTPRYAVVTWIGFDDERPIRADGAGGSLAAPVWTEFMKVAHEGLDPPEGF